jgi:hypothetical protein
MKPHRHRLPSHKWHTVRLAKISENARLRRVAACTVSFLDLDGVRHSVEVEADGLYLGLCAFRKHELKPGGLTQLEVGVRSSVKHTLTVERFRSGYSVVSELPKRQFLRNG